MGVAVSFVSGSCKLLEVRTAHPSMMPDGQTLMPPTMLSGRAALQRNRPPPGHLTAAAVPGSDRSHD
jgi:hypothetical protein